MTHYDILIIGGGPGGYVAAIKAAQRGKKVALIEKEALGGVCLNWGCIPTKALLKSAKVYETFKKAKHFGIVADMDHVAPDFTAIIRRKDQIVRKLTGGVGFLLKKNAVDVYDGVGHVIDKNTVSVGEDKLSTDVLIIATGARPATPPINGLKSGLESGFVVTSKEILSLEAMPKKLLIIGGGVIGVEFATIFNALGTDVTILERENDILLEVDADIKEIFKKKLKKDGVHTYTEAHVDRIGEDHVSAVSNGETHRFDADKVLLSAGMRANIEGLEHLNLTLENGAIKTDARCRTNLENVYAIGDVNGKMMLAHVASKEGIVAVMDIDGDASPIDYDHMPSGIYTFPEIAQVGLTEAACKARGMTVKTASFPLSANGKALAEGEREGLVKMIADAASGKILGLHILAPGATEMISEGVLGIELEAFASDFAHAVHPHPTLAEMIHEVAWALIDKPIHL